MRLLFIVLFFIPQAFGLSGNHLLTAPRKEYMAYFLKVYLPWHEQKFSSHMLKHPQKARIQKVVEAIDHWKVPDQPMLDQLLIGQTFKEGKSFFRYRAFVHAPLREKKEWFIEWDEQGLFCTLSPMVPREARALYFKRECRGGASAIVMGTEIDSRSSFNLFPGSTIYEWRTYSNETIESILYSSHDLLIDVLPKAYYPRIISHGVEALLPLDKVEINRRGEITVYYP